ncbi:MAG: [LysW]-aminoadipate/[LysW]-glutamate kinase [Candidatus Hermodarchaeota archaeon]
MSEKIVIKIGGDLLKENLDYVISDLIKLHAEKNKILLCHAGADILTAVAEKMGKPQIFTYSTKGYKARYVDEETRDIYVMVVAGLNNKQIVKEMIVKGLPAVGISGVDGNFIITERFKKSMVIIDGKRKLKDNYTGKPSKINLQLIKALWNNDFIPVVASIAISNDNELVGCDSDRISNTIAVATEADKLILLTDVDGVLDKNKKTINHINSGRVDSILENVTGGMKTKVLSALESATKGVKQVIIASGLRENPILKAINNENCTIITD